MSVVARPHVAAVLVFGASVLLVLADSPVWCSAVALACVLWRLGVGTGRFRELSPGRVLRAIFAAITALCVLAVIVSFRTLNGLAAGTALLVLMGALKLVESRTRRDNAIVIGVALFMLLAAVLADQALWRLPLYLFLVCGACAAMALNSHASPLLGTRVALRLSVKALAMAVPLAAACFLLFPRIAGQFWALQRGEQSRTGLSDEMAPGSIEKIANEYDPAFRVRFTGALPAREQLYFRGPVLNSFDGFTWRRNRGHYYPAPPLELLGEAIRYRVTLEPSDRPWIFALDTVAGSPRRDMFMAHDRQLTAMEDVTSTTSYDAESYVRTRSNARLGTLGRRYETELPADRNPRALALARELRARSTDDADYVRNVLTWFAAQGLEYTLDPGKTTIDSVDTTLFDSKRGFCAHFASAYATLMRAAGVPARVVTGYLGGEWNPVGEYLIVRQSDAHAWTEVWLDGRGWTRIDPTTVVAPERLQRGVYDLFGSGLPASSRLLHGSPWLTKLSQTWDGMNQWWRERVVEFDLRSQLDFLRKLGFDSPDWRQLGWIFAACLVAWFAWVSLSLRRSVARVKPDRLGRAWLAATAKLARAAPARAPDEGPIDFARRVAAVRPDLAGDVRGIAERYARLRYGAAVNDAEIGELERAVRRLRIP